MTARETGAVLDILTTAYPKFARRAGEKERTVMLWAELFAEDDLPIVLAAVKALIVSREGDWPPSPGDVKAYIRKLTMPAERTEAEAWAIVSRAVRRVDWNHPSKQFDQLPPDIQAAIGSPHTLVEWGKVDEEAFATVIASNFMRIYRAKRNAMREYDALPSSTKRLVAEYAEKLKLGDGT